MLDERRNALLENLAALPLPHIALVVVVFVVFAAAAFGCLRAKYKSRGALAFAGRVEDWMRTRWRWTHRLDRAWSSRRK